MQSQINYCQMKYCQHFKQESDNDKKKKVFLKIRVKGLNLVQGKKLLFDLKSNKFFEPIIQKGPICVFKVW